MAKIAFLYVLKSATLYNKKYKIDINDDESLVGVLNESIYLLQILDRESALVTLNGKVIYVNRIKTSNLIEKRNYRLHSLVFRNKNYQYTNTLGHKRSVVSFSLLDESYVKSKIPEAKQKFIKIKEDLKTEFQKLNNEFQKLNNKIFNIEKTNKEKVRYLELLNKLKLYYNTRNYKNVKPKYDAWENELNHIKRIHDINKEEIYLFNSNLRNLKSQRRMANIKTKKIHKQLNFIKEIIENIHKVQFE